MQPNRHSKEALTLALGGLCAMAIAMGMGRFLYTPILPFMVDGLSLSKAQAGLIASANFIGYLAGALTAIYTALPGTKRNWMLLALLISALTTAAMAMGYSIPLIVLLRFAGGAASAFVLVFASALVLERLSALDKAHLSSLHFGGVGIGIALSAIVVAVITAMGYGWRGQWLAGGALSLIGMFLAAICIPPQPESAAPSVHGKLASPALWRLARAYCLFGFGYVITATFLVDLVRSSEQTRGAEIYVWLLVGLFAAPSITFWNAVAARVGIGMAFAIAGVIEAIGVSVSVLLDSNFAVITAAVLLGGTFMGMTALGLVGARKLAAAAQSDARRAVALMTAAFGLGQIIGPTFAGYAFDATGSYFLPSMAAAAALLIAATITFRLVID